MSGFDGYKIPANLKKDFTPDETNEMRRAYQAFDINGDGHIDADELKSVLDNLGERMSADALNKMIDEVDTDGNKTVEWDEFCQMMHNIRNGKGEAAMAQVVKKAAKMFNVEGAGGAVHTFSEEERDAFTLHLNNCLGKDPDLSNMPMKIDSMELFENCQDGLMLCKLINLAEEGSVDERALNKKKNMNVYQKTENQNLAINAARAIGCQVVNVGAMDLIEGRPILILGLIWQIIKLQLTSNISLKDCPELVLLLEDGEELEDLLKLSAEDILLRWFNYHLKNAGSARRVTNFGGDLKDSECYSILLNQITKCGLVGAGDDKAKATQVIANANAMGVESFIQPNDIVKGNKKLNLGFCAQIFNTNSGLVISEEELADFDFAGLDLDDAGDTREERIFRMWINSLNIDGLYINDLFGDLTDGVAILKIMDKVEPGIVSWRKVNMSPKNKFKRVENCNYAVTLAKQMKFSMVNIGGLDICDKNKKLILGIIWQLMRRHTINILTNLTPGDKLVTDNEIIQWANDKVKSGGKPSSIRNFNDSSIASGQFLLDLCASVESRAVDPSIVSSGSTPEAKLNNARYAISVARKIGACVFLTPEDIVEVKSKMVLMFVASLWNASLSMA
ncbi:hypothetical protein TrVE_jg1997 [Triparma verrucosa]|uniref:Calmodulin n=1 Tax=Triparma verrucosa TaxID=1606542 RepID=A0A9W7BVV4_9STRA|nr:hypothetical protein TrVE_jg1997 [Triparma verrucosa]